MVEGRLIALHPAVTQRLQEPLKGSKVVAKVESHGQGDKVSIVKFRRRKHYLRMKNHRQPYTQVRITSISA